MRRLKKRLSRDGESGSNSNWVDSNLFSISSVSFYSTQFGPKMTLTGGVQTEYLMWTPKHSPLQPSTMEHIVLPEFSIYGAFF